MIKMSKEQYEFEGTVYTLEEMADFTNRMLPSQYDQYHETIEGERYAFEMGAIAHDEHGNDYVVYWIFSDEKGSERELDDYDYVNGIDRIEYQ